MRNLNLARFFVGIVLFFNLECAFAFISLPSRYVSGFELQGTPGVNMVSGMGILFLMWNIPYIFALISPQRNRTSLYEAIIMQAIGFFGESILFLGLPGGHTSLAATVIRFMIFDGGGLIILLFALWLSRFQNN